MTEGNVLAVVGTTAITDTDVEMMLAALGPRGKGYNTPEGRTMILEQLINQKLLLLDATRNLYEREPEFKAELAHAKEELLVNYAVKKAVSSVRVTDAEVQKYFDEHPEQFQGEVTVNASHILMDDETKAADLLQQIQEGAISFEEAAQKYSTCPSGQEGGCLGDFGMGQMVPEFDQACFSMTEGELRGPVKTQFGYHLIRLNQIHQAEPMQFAAIKEQLRDKLIGEKQQAAYTSKLNQLKILYPVERR